MTHGEKHGDWKIELLCTGISGIFFGGVNTLVGHPLDTVKTKMQAQSEFTGSKNTILGIIKNIYSTKGPVGFYSGWIPPFTGSLIFRSAQFATFEAAFTKWEHTPIMRSNLPMTGGLELRVLAGGLLSGTVRSLIECPFEYAKVKK